MHSPVAKQTSSKYRKKQVPISSRRSKFEQATEALRCLQAARVPIEHHSAEGYLAEAHVRASQARPNESRGSDIHDAH